MISIAHTGWPRAFRRDIWVNGASTHYVGVPFGGYKQSGVGREESIEELLACTQIKNVNVTLRRA